MLLCYNWIYSWQRCVKNFSTFDYGTIPEFFDTLRNVKYESPIPLIIAWDAKFIFAVVFVSILETLKTIKMNTKCVPIEWFDVHYFIRLEDQQIFHWI